MLLLYDFFIHVFTNNNFCDIIYNNKYPETSGISLQKEVKPIWLTKKSEISA